MSKLIYEEALDNTQTLLALVNLKELNSKKKLDMLNQIEQALEQSKKQEQLLKLYQELDKINGWLLLCFTIGGEETEKEYHQLGGGVRRHELIKQIKELENDK